ncbi:alpha-mannosidase [Flammeovirgaceae bacterium SG7u.111]|nr:alpha-mannosidase [Flammeovirgaceae bacterium SG7u.132]WPO35454.1 alpha-mannosidase [Flammeovirgaceae bacterium SG7u.111]
MRKHSELTIARIEKFRDSLKYSYYYSLTPLKARYHRTREPISYHDALKASYQEILPGTKWGANYDCAWFDFEGVVPADHAGKEVVALIDLGGEGCVFDKEGNPVQGLTNKRVEWTMAETIIKKRVYLFEEATGGEHVHLRVDAGANNILGVENVLTYESMEDGVFNQADLAIFDRQKWHMYIEYDMLTNLMMELYEKTRHRKLLIYALNEVINKFGDGTPEEIAECRAILKVELDRKANSSAIEASAIGHAHIDVAWLWPLRETVRKTSRTFSTALRLMEEYPDYKFGASQPVLYEMMKEHYPGLYERLKAAVKREQWECQGAMWVEADCNLTSGESLARQIIYGKKFFKDEFDVEVNNLWLPDVFGYSAALPQLLIKSDVEYFMTQKISWNQFNTFPHHTFIWKGLDGTPIFSHFLAPNNYRSDVSSKDLINLERENFDTDRVENALFLFGAGDGGGGPSRIYIEKLRRAKDIEDLPKVTMEFARDFFIKAEKNSRDLQEWVGELYLELHRGTLTTHARTKKMNRRLEYLFREIEYFYAAYLMDKYPQEMLEKNWKILLLNQFHDIIPGTSITRVHIESMEQYAAVEKELLDTLKDGHEQFVGAIHNELEDAYVLYNSLNWDRKSSVELKKVAWESVVDQDGNAIPSQVITQNGKERTVVEVVIPSMGYIVVGNGASQHKDVLENNAVAYDNILENDRIKVFFDLKTGQITRLFDKEAEREALAPEARGNAFKLYDDNPNLWDAWDVDIFYEETKSTSPELVSMEILESGPIRAAIKFEYEANYYSISQIVSISRYSKRIDFKTTVNWQETNKMLRVEFPVNVHANQANFEIQYGHVPRPTHYNTSWDMAQFEVVGHKWADLSQPNYGVALMNDCKYGYKIKGNTINLNLLRSPKNPDPLADMHIHEFTYSLFPHLGNHIHSNVIRQAYQLNIPLYPIKTGKQENEQKLLKSLVRVDRYNVIIEAVKKAEYSNDIILRMYEANGVDCTAVIDIDLPFKEVWLSNIVERDLEKLSVENKQLKMKFKPFEIHTIRLTS